MSATNLATPVVITPSRGRGRGLLRTLLGTPLGIAAVTSVAIVLLLALLAPVIWGDAADAYHTDALRQGPSAEHLAGTDSLGRDILLRVLVATRLSVGLALGATAIAVTLGLLLGTLPAVAGRRVGRFVAAAIDVAVAFPALLLAIFFAVIFGVGEVGTMVALGVAGGPWFARLTLTLSATVASRDFVAAARVNGVSRGRILLRHVLPNIGEPLAINATLGAALNLLAFAGLSFLGIGVQAPSYDWGRLLNEGLNGIYVNPWAAIAPGVAIVLAGLAFNLTGELAAQVIGRRTREKAPREPLPGPDDAPALPVIEHGGGDDERETLLDVRDLWVRFPSGGRWVAPVRGIDLRLHAGESVGVVGESGSGKSLTALAIAQLLQEPAAVAARTLRFDGHDLRDSSSRQTRAALADSLAMIFQDPMSSLNPAMRVGPQLAEVATAHHGASRRGALAQAVQQLSAVRIPDPERRARQYPHEFSGGMRQRAMIGIGLMGTPRLLIADEPTTALDVTVQRQVLELLSAVRAEADSALLLISHDIAVVAGMCERVVVMYAGVVVEDLPVAELLAGPRHPYTRALLAALPDMETPRERPLATIPGRPPAPAELTGGCPFAARCAVASDRCREQEPPLATLADTGAGHRVACWHPQAGAVGAADVKTETEAPR
ncbi:dipeptide/oligopeptide/nickel ABC transporter permease/ATP-binding protein [Conexibacter stalactiti]|uniref:Dipeptide/oligopeptide/nickel ABC transporter permease/ATP-binding protein n=1 Tax=Conexibacter stalactiti TaxID=1940611 RepID=A0ABU4HX19_9ACTN|nr:dipeptide/oligopeptide/nickel ABC transporter permease/ATP-binding protein [Conexibacter stalactiti]MDW5597404.1 dipeptide/oligopeptide/nickel ABC transporter permease/ATP-binding protein [Conexibacter stalactiti]MEC5038046.1 dipeptide/oligopeptide/nickel ABC transporter permease/ATP-binding protein [Conexibacter stalactiti]